MQEQAGCAQVMWTGEPSIGVDALPARFSLCVSLPSRARSAPPCPRPQRARARDARRTAASSATAHSLAPAETFPAVRSAADQRRSARVATLAADAPHACPASSSACSRRARSTTPTYAERRAAYDDAKRTVKRLTGRRKLELGAVVKTLEGVAARGQLTASRLRAAVPDAAAQPRVVDQRAAAELRAGASASTAPRSSGSTTPAPASRSRCSATSARSTRSGARARHARSAQAVDELLPLAAERAGGARLGVLLRLPRGRPPWVSGLAQGTALQALARAAHAAAAARTRCSRCTSARPGDLRARRRRRACACPAGARRPLRAVLLRAGPADPQRLHPVARSASTTTAASPPTTARHGAVRRGRGARPRGGARPTTPARGRCTRAGPSRTSPTSATTRCCATSSSRCATARRPRSTAAPRSTSRPT